MGSAIYMLTLTNTACGGKIKVVDEEVICVWFLRKREKEKRYLWAATRSVLSAYKETDKKN